MKKIYTLLFGLALSFGASAQCTELFFSEYAEGSGNNKYMEIYNPSSSTVDLSTYTIFQIGNGGSFTNSFQLYGTLASNEVFLFCTDQMDASVLAIADTAMSYPSIAHFNGDDCMLLLNGTDTIDQLGERWSDPGSNWAVGSGSTKDYTLVRKFSVESPDTAWASTSIMGWDVHPKNTWSYAGSHSSNCHPPTVAEVKFAKSKIWVDENAGTASIEISIASPSATDTTKVEVSITGGTAVMATDYAVTSSTMLAFNPGDATSKMVTFSLTDNAMAAADKTVELALINLSSSAKFGNDSTMLMTIVNDDYATASIKDIIIQDADLKATNEGMKYEITGTVYGVDLDGNAGLSFTIIDATGGMNIFNRSDVNDYVVTEGDEITARGEIDFYNGLTELKVDSIKVNSSGNTLMAPTEVAAPSEATESNFIKLTKVWITNDTTTLWPDNGNVQLTNDNADTFQIRIDRDIPGIVGMAVSFDTMVITGLGGQYDRNAPYDEGYQIFPRGLSDIAEYVPVNSVREFAIEARVYPNPTSSNLTVVGSEKWDAYQVYSILGVKVAEGSLNNNNLNVSNLAEGTYILKLSSDKKSGVARFVINR